VLFRDERGAVLNRFDGEHPSPKKNMVEWITLWSRPGRTVKDVIVNASSVAFIRSTTKVGIVTVDFENKERIWGCRWPLAAHAPHHRDQTFDKEHFTFL
jgi:hypothetical protein